MVERLVRNEKVRGSNPLTSKAKRECKKSKSAEWELRKFSANGQPDQAERHRARKKKFKSSLVEFVVEFGRGGELGDATGEVAKGIALAAEKLGDPGHKMKQVKVPKELPWKRGRAEFKQRKDPAWLKDSVDFRKALGAVGKVT